VRSVTRAIAWTVLVATLALWPTLASAQSVAAEMRTATGESIASVTFTQAAQDVLISIAFRNRTALVGTHPVQIRAVGRCDAPGPPLVDLPNLVIGPAGVGVYNLTAPATTLDAVSGRSLVILDQPDSSTVVACGVIGGGQATGERPALLTSLAIGLTGMVLFAGGVLLRRGA
jgi:Cu/Zn superoxide dismutase